MANAICIFIMLIVMVDGVLPPTLHDTTDRDLLSIATALVFAMVFAP